jgi:hypothetical protein
VELMTFDEWLQIGVDNKWCGPAVCATHDGIPMSEAEEEEWEQGSDPCQHIVRLYEDETVAEAINAQFSAYQWRFPKVR